MMQQNDIATSIGFVNFYGNSPSVDLLKGSDLKRQKEVRILLNGSCDIRHALKTITDNLGDFGEIESIEFYILERHPELVARAILMTEIVNNAKLSYRERVELFYDVYWNCFMREKSASYIDERIRHLEDIVCDFEKCCLGVKNLWDFSCFKYKDRDLLVDIFRRWSTKVPFDMEKYRDNRLRHLYKERYDFRKNLTDWDYIWGLKESARIIHPREYKDWRGNGVAFEVRTATYITPNRTMGAYIDGNRKVTRDSCIVLGFWGDIILSPFMTMGIETDSQPEKKKLFRIRNKHNLHISQHVAEFNAYAIIYKLEKLEDYHMNWDDEDEIKTKETDEEMKLEVIKEENETKEGEMIKEIEKNRKKGGERQNLISLEPKKEEPEDDSTLYPELVKGLKEIKISFFPVSGDLEKISGKKKFKSKFDIVCLGFMCALDLRSDALPMVMKKNSIAYQENSHFLVPLEMKKRPITNENMVNKANKSLKSIDSPYPAQLKFINVGQKEEEIKQV